MGQQQLLLVILVTIIVGIATVVAINIFGTASEQANRDAVRQDLLGAAVQAQGIWARPTLMDGAGRDFSELTQPEILRMLNIPANSEYDNTANTLTNENGTYVVNTNTQYALQVQGTPSGGSEVIVLDVEYNTTTGNWEVEIDGEDDSSSTATAT